MQISEAQLEVRSVYLRGAVGQIVSGAIWLLSAALGTWVSAQTGMLALYLVGIFIFPLTQLGLKLLGRPTSLRPENPLRWLAMQVAFTVPLAIPVIAAAASANPNMFYPAFLIIVGAHYLPFIFLYGMRDFAVLAALFLAAGVAVPLLAPGSFALGGWVGGAVLVAFGVWQALRLRGA